MQVTETDQLRQLLSFSQSLPAQGATKLLELLAQTGALLKGHFELMSGRHSGYFLRFSQLGWDVLARETIAKYLLGASPFAAEATTIVCAETSSLFLAKAAQEITGKELVVARVDSRRRPTSEIALGQLDAGAITLVVSDVITTGSSLAPLLKIGKKCVGVAAFASRPGAAVLSDLTRARIQHAWLVHPTWETWEPEQCPHCRGEKGSSRKPLLAAEFN